MNQPKGKTKFRKHYISFNRDILAEFMSQKELNEMDKKYTTAKITRFVRKAQQWGGLQKV